MSSEWTVPAVPLTLLLDNDELALVDWVLCGASRLLPDIVLEDLVTPWHDVRMAVWQLLAQGQKELPMAQETAKILLALCPTTHRWGTGGDCGYSLKTKLARFLRGESNGNDGEAHKDETSDSAKG